MRLFSPVPVIARTPRKTQCLSHGGVRQRVQPGQVVLCSLQAMHRHPRLWEAPNQFRPSRFLDSNGDATFGRAQFLPFGGGPRRCVGQQLAMMQAKAAIATLLVQFDFRASESRPIGDQSGPKTTEIAAARETYPTEKTGSPDLARLFSGIVSIAKRSRTSAALRPATHTTISMLPRDGVTVRLKARRQPRRRWPKARPALMGCTEIFELEVTAGRYRLRLARNHDDKRRVKQLRFDVFNKECGQGPSFPTASTKMPLMPAVTTSWS